MLVKFHWPNMALKLSLQILAPGLNVLSKPRGPFFECLVNYSSQANFPSGQQLRFSTDSSAIITIIGLSRL